ncbi:enoyl-CoA hydratase/isomerase family protein [Hirschia maritima]|uniref:enoyl-CoA hydratase/isomerase family protein n=1 Tax=Hirschia maritima TaxID=1121961 RepID=UPI000370F947|nr:enoyl-CoA hydratase-related protein [Hirschia maritima]
MTKTIRLDIDGPLAELVLNKPDKRNALSLDMWQAIPHLVSEVDANKSVKVLIIHGGDAGAFAAGADISEFEEIYKTEESAKESADAISNALNAIENCSKPTIAAIDGACVGGGVSLAMTTDLRIAHEKAKFGVTPGKLGLVYPAGDTRRLLAAVGPGTTKDILFTGRIFAATEAFQMKLIDRLETEKTGLEAGRELADQICSLSQWSTRATKKMIKGLQYEGWTPSSKEAQELFLAGFANEDFKDGFKAFLEKRPPNFTFS